MKRFIVPIVMVIGGFSGKLVLRGTNSSELLIVVGFLFFMYSLYAYFRDKQKAAEEEARELKLKMDVADLTNVGKKKCDNCGTYNMAGAQTCKDCGTYY